MSHLLFFFNIYLVQFLLVVAVNMCFWQFEDARDAEDAIRGRDGYNFDQNRLRVCFMSVLCA